jgi:putative membrane-bound dehydrogenase-like protein
MRITNSNTAVFLLSCLITLLLSCQQEKGSNTLEGFQIHPDFKIELVASEPLIFDPVDMKFDQRGQAYVLEMPGYPFSEAESRLIALEDENQDGIYDKRIVYAESLGLASSFMPYKEGFLVAAPPHLLWLKDEDGDKQADQRETLMSGFEMGNLQHNYNGLTYGLDNWIYAANGGNDGKPYYVEKPEQPLDLRGEDFRFRLETKDLERIGQSSGGFELAFDNWGNMYETHNLEHVSQLIFRGSYIADLPTEPSHSLKIISDHEENGLSRIYPIGEQETRVNHPEQSGYFSGSCGITFYGGNAFPEGFNNQLFVADVVLNLIHLDLLSPNKSANKTSRNREKAEFLASTDRAFRPVNMTTGPDGALYLMDMHRKVIEHPEWIPDEMEKEMDLNAGKEKGRIYRITPKKNWQPTQLEFDKNNAESLVAALKHPNQWHRMTAQRLMVASANAALVPLLQNLFDKTDNNLAKLHALWTLEGLGQLKTETLEQVFLHKHPALKVNALKIAELRLNQNPALIKKVIDLANDEATKVRMQAALALSTLESVNYQQYKKEIQTALFNALQQKDNDIWLAMAVASAAKEEASLFVEQLLEQSKKLNAYEEEVVLILTRWMGKQQAIVATEQSLSSLSKQSNIAGELKAKIIEALATGWKENALKTNSLKGISRLLQQIEKTATPAIVHASGNLRKALKLPISMSTKRQIAKALVEVTNRNLPVEERLVLLKLIELEDFRKRATVLYTLLDNREPLLIQEESLRQLWEAKEASIANKLVALWPSLGPDARKKASDILLYKPIHQGVLLTALEEGKINMGEMNFDLERRRTLLWWSENDAIKKRAEALFSDAGVVTRKAAIEQLRPALHLEGDLVKGKEQFINLCSQCHQYGAIGKNVGPVLTEINRKSKESLLYDILDPNAAVDTKYINHQVKTKAGNIYTGIIARETDTEISLKMLGGTEQTILKSNIDKLVSLGISMMPEGQEANLKPQDLADLLAFLQQSNL